MIIWTLIIFAPVVVLLIAMAAGARRASKRAAKARLELATARATRIYAGRSPAARVDVDDYSWPTRRRAWQESSNDSFLDGVLMGSLLDSGSDRSHRDPEPSFSSGGGGDYGGGGASGSWGDSSCSSSDSSSSSSSDSSSSCSSSD